MKLKIGKIELNLAGLRSCAGWNWPKIPPKYPVPPKIPPKYPQTELEHIAEFEIGRGVLGFLIHRFIADSYAQNRMAEEVAAIKREAEKRERESWNKVTTIQK